MDDDRLVIRVKLDNTMELWSRDAMSKEEFMTLLGEMIVAARKDTMKRIG